MSSTIVGLFATLCIGGTLHGAPITLCKEFQLAEFTTAELCESGKIPVMTMKLADLSRVNINVSEVHKVHCAPAIEADFD